MSKRSAMKTSGRAGRRIQRELELVCGTDCSGIVHQALRSARLAEVPEDPDGLRNFIYDRLLATLIRYHGEDVATRLCEVVATALLQNTGVVRLSDLHAAEARQSAVEIPPPRSSSLSVHPRLGSLTEIAAVKPNK